MNKLWVAAALVAVMLAGVAIYSTGDPGGNVAVADADLGERVQPQIIGEVAGFRLLDQPMDLTALSFKNRDGAEVQMADWAGKTVLLNLWATWCAPCREEMPELQELNAHFADRAFEVVPVSIDQGDASKPLGFYAETGLTTLPFYHDATMRTFQGLKQAGLAFGMPTTVLVDREGFARGVLNGPAAWSSPDALALIEEAMGPS